MITAEQFEKATGRKPEQDDLERCNCRKAGQPGHLYCGWDRVRNMPCFMPHDIPGDNNDQRGTTKPTV